MITSRSFLLRINNVSGKSLQKIKTHILPATILFRKLCLVGDNVKKCCRAGHATSHNMAHTQWIPDTQGYKHTLRIRNIYCFSNATMVARTYFNVTLYVYCLSCSIYGLLVAAESVIVRVMNRKPKFLHLHFHNYTASATFCIRNRS